MTIRPLYKLCLLFFTLFLILSFSCASVPMATGFPAEGPKSLSPDGPYTILSWNLGYGALNRQADFIVDGGRHFLSLTKRQVAKNIRQLADTATDIPADFLIFQESSTGVVLNYYYDLFSELKKKLPDRHSFYSPKAMSNLGLPDSAGQASFLSGAFPEYERIELRAQDFYAIVRIRHHALVTHTALPGGKILTIINVHLSAFDKDEDKRLLQLEILDEYAASCIKNGQSVILGGDFNYVLHSMNKEWTTNERDLEWVVPLSFVFEKSGLRLAGFLNTPTVRSLEKPFVEGENYQGVIDGFFVSQDIEVLQYRAFDFGYELSDHNPVFMEFLVK